MNQKIYLGIDLAKGTSRVTALGEDGDEIESPFNISNSKEGIEKLLSKLNSYKKENLVVGMEVSLKLLGKHVLISKTKGHILYSFKSISGKEISPGTWL